MKLIPQHSYTTSEIKFDLFLKAREIRELNQTLERIFLFNRKDRLGWVKENSDLINQLLDSLMQDAMLVIDGLNLDQESIILSVELMSNLRNALSTLRSLVKDKEIVSN